MDIKKLVEEYNNINERIELTPQNVTICIDVLAELEQATLFDDRDDLARQIKEVKEFCEEQRKLMISNY